MGLLTFEYNSDEFTQFYKIVNMFPIVSNQLLGYIGNQSKRILKKELLSGNPLTYRTGNAHNPKDGGSMWRDKAGRPKVSYGIKYSKYVTIRSYPANFFTVTNKRQKRRDIWGKLKMLTNSQLDRMLRDFDKDIFHAQLEKFTEKPGSRQRF